MPTIKNGDATIYYEEHGKGFPDPHLRAGGAAVDDRRLERAVRADQSGHRVVGELPRDRDGPAQRRRRSRARRSRAKDGWHTYTSDHIAVLDHLKIDKCHLFGQCIGGSFIANLIEAQPQRVASADHGRRRSAASAR